ncbi:hypothetical protein [Pedobacter rhizosphaerae]|uniref:Cthe-2314-like HEPN domain-containing protein n=1 Tax=Pedobacter rhizosphaerae TaxID=390241 RepID=A0A1H9PKA1_9SPHI|nr:hypothetical protein [Pedobacter rhizosphaerae]SER48614.1 hypothetical protein SAMN04488023_1102 [Pedobacter rhizosphaerae]
MEKPQSLQSLISSIELNKYGIIRSLMKRRKNHHFFAPRVKKPNNAYFEFTPNSAEWSDNFTIIPFVNNDGFRFDEVMIDLKLKGSINEYNNSGRTFFSEPMDLELTIRAYVEEDGWVSPGNVHFLNTEQRALLEFHKKYELELKRLGLMTIFETEYDGQEAFSFFTRIWKNVDNENSTMVKDTSLDYFHELGEAHRNIMYSVSCANMWGRYTSHFTDNSYRMDSGIVFPHQPTFYDTRHIFYLEAAIEEIYTFYERVAYIAYIFLQPLCFKAGGLSYNKLFEKQTVKELKLKFIGLENNIHFKWFLDRLKKEHKVLSGYRHPLIHYKTANTFIKGSYSASRTRHWLDNAMDGEELTKLHKQMEEILKFVNNEVLACHSAFEQIVLLCESLEIPNDLSEG